jgi:hypothetical protein
MIRKLRVGPLSRGPRSLREPVGPSPELADALDGLDALLSDWGQARTSDGQVQSARQMRKRRERAGHLRYHLVALIYSPREPYSWIRSVCGYTLLCVAVLGLGWLLASAIG